MTYAQRIERLREEMGREGIDAWLVPSSDPHQSEYVCARWQTRAWLSGFRGSAGTLVVMREEAGLWTDPRYHLRASHELEGSGITLFKSGLPGVPTMSEWLNARLLESGTLGFDGRVVSVKTSRELLSAAAARNLHIRTDLDLVDRLWEDRPDLPSLPIFEHEESYAGESRESKIARTRAELQRAKADMTILSALDDIAWLFNFRGDDVPGNPVALCFAAISTDDAVLFMEPGKIGADMGRAISSCGTRIRPYGEIREYVRKLGSGTVILIDPEKTGWDLCKSIPQECVIIEAPSLPAAMKALRNDTQIEGMRASHLRDGLAVTRWLFWLEHRDPAVSETEITLAETLEAFRSELPGYRGRSFDTICGYGSNSAVGHYSASPETTPEIRPEGILLVDSGGQYRDGTTDITRTLCLGSPTAEQRKAFTTVLACLIRLSSTRFPKGTTGMKLDAIAREPLWREGWNCRHGIGHGVGHYLNVHEGPQRFSPDCAVVIQSGMSISCEPGVYFEGGFGVRIENVLLARSSLHGAFGEFLEFETMTLCPVELDLVDPSFLGSDEIRWLNAYHRKVYIELVPFLDAAEAGWLARKTRPIQQADPTKGYFLPTTDQKVPEKYYTVAK